MDAGSIRTPPALKQTKRDPQKKLLHANPGVSLDDEYKYANYYFNEKHGQKNRDGNVRKRGLGR